MTTTTQPTPAASPATPTPPAASGRISATGEALRRALDGRYHDLKQRWRDTITADDAGVNLWAVSSEG